MKRLGIFQMYDPDGIVEDYITYLLDDICDNFQSLIITVCGTLRPEESQKLSKYTNRIFYRDNYGYDAYAFKDTILNYLDEDELKDYDELVLFNDTFYGPAYPFSKVFSEMESVDLDFWGLTKHAANQEFREHIQSYFLAVRRIMLQSSSFIEFWKTLDLGEITFKNLVHNFEVRFTDFFEKRGFRYAAYVKDDMLNGSMQNNYNHYLHSPYRLMKDYHMPVVKRKVFTESKNLYTSAGEEVPMVFAYLKNNCGYDTDMIWKDLLRKADMFDIKNHLNLNYILPLSRQSTDMSEKRVVVIAHITYDELVDECLEYLENVPDRVDVYITSYNESLLENAKRRILNKRKRISTLKLENRGRDVAAIFVGCREIVKSYDYVCFVHDKRTTGMKGPYVIGASFQSLVWENTLKSEGYIENILKLFDTEKRLGLLCPPKPFHGDYYYCNVSEWAANYDACCEIRNRLGMHVELKRDKPPFCLSTCFWCKREALNSLWELPITYEDFPEEPCPQDGELNHALERMLVFSAQDAGFYSGIVETPGYASLDLQNREVWLRNPRVSAQDRSIKIAYFVSKYNSIYIYGAGIEAAKVADILNCLSVSVKGFIVSDEYFDSCNSTLKPLVRLGTVPINEETGIIVGMNLSNSAEVETILEEKGYGNVYYFNEKERER